MFSPCNRDSKLLGTLWDLLDLDSISRKVIPKLTKKNIMFFPAGEFHEFVQERKKKLRFHG